VLKIAPNANARIFETRLRVRYQETDQMGVVYHSNYLVWFEVGRTELLRELGFDYKAMELQHDAGVVVVDARVRYRSPARYDDLLLVRTRVAQLRRHILTFGYEIMREIDGTVLATGETVHVVTNRNLEKRSLPEDCEAALLAAMGSRE
jgi:acyl-CoA thioester hydrolase